MYPKRTNSQVFIPSPSTITHHHMLAPPTPGLITQYSNPPDIFPPPIPFHSRSSKLPSHRPLQVNTRLQPRNPIPFPNPFMLRGPTYLHMYLLTLSEHIYLTSYVNLHEHLPSHYHPALVSDRSDTDRPPPPPPLGPLIAEART